MRTNLANWTGRGWSPRLAPTPRRHCAEPRTNGWKSHVAAGAGRTGAALACLAVLDGVPAGDAVAYVREHYDARAVETPWQRRYVVRFSSG